MKNAIYLLFLFFLLSCSAVKQLTTNCYQNRGAFDIGSGSTKALFAKVDVCRGKIAKVLFDKQEPLKFKASLKKNDGKISPLLAEKALVTLKQWKRHGQSLGITHFSGVATEVFRQAHNGSILIKHWNEQTKLNIKLITQQQEALYGYWSAMAQAQSSPDSVLVWDIGGGSMQMTLLYHDLMKTYLGKTASVSFKERLFGARSPNPLSPVGAKRAAATAKSIAKSDIPLSFKKMAQGREVIGIGGVHYYSLGKKLTTKKNPYYTQKSLEEKLIEYSYKTDRQIGGAYSATDVTNMALVLGFMQALDIAQVKAVKGNLAHGILLAPTHEK